MADATAITGIIVSGVVGPSLAAWWARSQARSQDRRNRESGDLKELRILLDEAMDRSDTFIRCYGEFSAAWRDREEESNADTKATMSAAHASLETAAFALFQMHSRFDARLGPNHALSQGFEKLHDDASRLVATPGGVVTAYDEFTKEDRDGVHELWQTELALFFSRLLEWIAESLPLAGLRLPNFGPRERFAAPHALNKLQPASRVGLHSAVRRSCLIGGRVLPMGLRDRAGAAPAPWRGSSETLTAGIA